MAYIRVYWGIFGAMAKGELNLQQENFVKHYLHNGNASEAAILAGYSKNGAEKAGYKLLQKPKIKARIDAVRKKAEEETQMSHDKMLGNIIDFIERAKKDDRPSALPAEAKGYELICKMEGYFERDKRDNAKGYDVAISNASENNAEENCNPPA